MAKIATNLIELMELYSERNRINELLLTVSNNEQEQKLNSMLSEVEKAISDSVIE